MKGDWEYLTNNWRIYWDIINKELSAIPQKIVLSIFNLHQYMEKLYTEAYNVCMNYVPLRKPTRSGIERKHRRMYRRNSGYWSAQKQVYATIKERYSALRDANIVLGRN